jgi:hypothetical protein
MPAELDQHVDVQSYGAQAAGGPYEQQYDPHAGQQQGYEQQPPLDAQQYDPEQLAQLQEHAAAAAAAQQGQDPISALLAAGAAVGDPNAGDGDVDVDVSSSTAMRMCDGSTLNSSSECLGWHACSTQWAAQTMLPPPGLTCATDVTPCRAATQVATAM